MKTALIVFVLGFAALADIYAQGGPSAAGLPEIESIRGPYQKRLEANRAARDSRAATITRSYLGGLDRLQTEVTTHGDLNGALLVKAERERAAGGQDPSPDERKTMAPQLMALRLAYEKEREPIFATARQADQQLTREYLGTLDALQKRFTTLNQLDKALAVRTEHDRITAESTEGAASPAQAAAAPGQVLPPAARVVSATDKLDPALAAKISAAVKGKTYTQTESSEKPGGGSEEPEQGALLVGFEFAGDHSEGVPDIRSIRPLYLTREGVIAGKDRGELPKVTDRVVAHPGYAVGGLETFQNPMRIQGIQVTFMKIDPVGGRLDSSPSGVYKSKWYGTRGKGKPKVLGGDGKLVIGVFGLTGADADTIGLVQMP